MDLSKFNRVNQVFLVNIPLHGALKKLIDAQMIYEQMKCVKHFCTFKQVFLLAQGA